MATLFRATSGEAVEVFPADHERGFTLTELHALIGGGCRYIETIRLSDNLIMVIDEEGKLHNKTVLVNEPATRLFWAAGGIHARNDVIVGNAVICSYPDEID